MDRAPERPVIAVTGPTRGAIGPRSCVHVGVLLAGGRPLSVLTRTDVLSYFTATVEGGEVG